MVKWLRSLQALGTDLKKPGDHGHGETPFRYRLLRRNLILIMVLVTIIPLTLMAVVNFLQYRKALTSEIIQPVRGLTNKSRHSFEVFLAERLSTVDFISSAYTYDQLADENALRRLFHAAKQEFRGFVDIGLIDSRGFQVSYVGPYDLKGKQYSEQKWFTEVQIRGSHISDVFLGHREFPHIVLAVQHMTETGQWWVVRATIDTAIFDELIHAMSLGFDSDAFLINRDGILQTDSKFYGRVLEQCQVKVFPDSMESEIAERTGPRGQELVIAHSSFLNSGFILVVVMPRAQVLRAWFTLKSELFYLFIGSVLIIVLVIIRLTGKMVQRIKDADERRQSAFRELEHTHKLSSIGRLAAGVAHEINNPLAIIDQKTGLLKDLIERREEFDLRDKFMSQIESVLKAVDRCRTVTHRLLGFARRMEVDIELLNINELIKEVLGFLEKEFEFRNIAIQLDLLETLPQIDSDRGQLQQVFLNILTNAFAAIEKEGRIIISTANRDAEFIAVAIKDDGCGMTEQTRERIFEPFFTTKKDYGTGLGLSITYGIIKKLGGDVDVESQQNIGTTFIVYLPRKSAMAEP